MKSLAIGTLVLMVVLVLAACACSNGNTNAQPDAVNCESNAIATAVSEQGRMEANEGHGRVKLFEGIEFDSLPQKIIAGQTIRIAFRVLLCNDYQSRICELYDAIDATHVDSYPMMLIVSAGGLTSDTERVNFDANIAVGDAFVRDVMPDTLFVQNTRTGQIFLKTTLNEIRAGKRFEFSVAFPKRGDCEINVDMEYVLSRCDYIRTGKRGTVRFEVQ